MGERLLLPKLLAQLAGLQLSLVRRRQAPMSYSRNLHTKAHWRVTLWTSVSRFIAHLPDGREVLQPQSPYYLEAFVKTEGFVRCNDCDVFHEACAMIWRSKGSA